MLPEQDIIIKTSKGEFVIYIQSQQDDLVLIPPASPLFKTFISPINDPNDWRLEPNALFTSSIDGFGYALDAIKAYCDINEIEIISLDNNGACELISIEDEKRVLSNKSMNIQVKHNGKIV